MNGLEYQRAITKLALSQTAAARFLGVDDRTSRRWIANEVRIPRSVAILLRLMIRYRLTPDGVLALVQRGSKTKLPQVPASRR